MRLGLYIAFLALACALLTGCGGSGSSGTVVVGNQTTRYLAGYIYVKGNGGTGSGVDAIVSPSSTPPTGYFAPTAGTVTLTVADGTLVGRSPGQYVRTMTDGNDIIVAAKSLENSVVGVSAAGLQLNGTAKALAGFNVNLGAVALNNTTLAMDSASDSTYVPGPPTTIKVTVNGIAPPTEMISGGTYTFAFAVLDQNNVALSGQTPSIVSSDITRVTYDGIASALVPATGTLVASGDVTITTSLAAAPQLTSAFTANFNYGTITTVTMTRNGAATLLWDTAAPVAATCNFTALVKNEMGSPMPNVAVNFTDGNAPANVWASSAPANTAAFNSASVNTDATGSAVVTVSAPGSVAGPLVGGDLTPKGLNTVTATAGSVPGSDTVTIVRPLASVSITGPSRLDVGASSTVSGSQSYQITGGVDVDGLAVATPAGAVAWSVNNTAGAGNIGDPDDITAQSSSAAIVNAATGVVTSGATAGQAVVSVTVGGVPSNNITTDIYGAPTKISFTPAAVDNTGYHGVNGNTLGLSFDLIDTWGHTIPPAEYVGFNHNGSVDSPSGASLQIGAGRTYMLTFGNQAGTMTTTVTGTWTGAFGGSASINKTRNTLIGP